MLLEEKLNKADTLSAAASSSDESGTNHEVRQLYERAVEAAPKDSLSRADLGRFLLIRDKNYEKAQVSYIIIIIIRIYCYYYYHIISVVVVVVVILTPTSRLL